MDGLDTLVTQQKFRANELRNFMNYIGEFANISLVTVSGDPPDDYLLSFDLLSLVPKEDKTGVRGGKGHRIQFHLPVDYPQDPPEVRALSPLFHPAVNPTNGAIDVSEVWGLNPNLTAVVEYLAKVFTGKVYKLPKPANPAAVAIYDRIKDKLPLDTPVRLQEVDAPEEPASEPPSVGGDSVAAEEYADQLRLIRRLIKCNQLFIASRELATLPPDLWFPERQELEVRTRQAKLEAERLETAIRDLAEIRTLISQNRIYELAGRMAEIAPDLWFPERQDIEAGIREAKVQCDRLFKQAALYEEQGAYSKALGCAQAVLQHIPDHPDAKVLIGYLEQAVAIKARGGDPRKSLVNPLSQGLKLGPAGQGEAQSLSESADEEKESAGAKLSKTLKIAFDKVMTALNTPWGRITAGIVGALFFVLVIVLFVNDNSALNRANQGLEQARTEMRDKHFINAKTSLERTKETLVGRRLTVLAFRKGTMVDRLNEVLNSEELKEGVIREERIKALENEIIETVMRAGLRLDERIATEVTWMSQNVTPVLVDAQRAFETGRKQDVARIYQEVLEQRKNLPLDMQTALQKFWEQKERALNLVIPSAESGAAGPSAGR